MGRPLRIIQYEFPYSVTTRCNNRNFYLRRREAAVIFEKVVDKLKKIPKSKEDASPKYEFELHHFTIMSNHYHLVLSASKATPVDRLMQQLNSMTARAINRLLGRRGHLWEDRYECRILNTLDYLKKTIAYVYHNPLKAKLIKSIFASKSTFSKYWNQKLPDWLTPDPFLREAPPEDWPILLKELVLDSFDPKFAWLN